MDVIIAFLYRFLDEEIYIMQPTMTTVAPKRGATAAPIPKSASSNKRQKRNQTRIIEWEGLLG